MFRHHRDEGERPLGEADRAELISSGRPGRGVVMRITPCEGEPARSAIEVQLDSGSGSARFTEEVANLYQPEAGTPDAQRLSEARASTRHPGRVPKVQMPISAGSRIPVRCDPDDERRVTVDVPALQKLAVDWFVQQQKAAAGAPAREAASLGPPWDVPDHCPNCGAPLDQATATVEADPHCDFCHEPVPVQPRARH